MSGLGKRKQRSSTESRVLERKSKKPSESSFPDPKSRLGELQLVGVLMSAFAH